MSTNTLIESFEAEREEIRSKLDDLHRREEFLQKAIAEIRRASPGGRGRGAPKTKEKVKTGTRARRKGGMTVKDAILKVVADAGEPIAPAEIIPATVKLSGGAEPSIRTQLNNLSRSGQLKQVPHEGRGFKYTIGDAAAPATEKTSAKKKAPAKRKGASKKKSAAKKKAPTKPETVEPEAAPAAEPPADQSPGA